MSSKSRPQARKSGTIQAKLVAENACRLCERSREMRKLTKHRLVPGRCGGAYVTVNVVPLCWTCHALVEVDVTARRMLRAKLWPAEVAHAISRMGEPWLDRTYPRPAMGLDDADGSAKLVASRRTVGRGMTPLAEHREG